MNKPRLRKPHLRESKYSISWDLNPGLPDDAGNPRTNAMALVFSQPVLHFLQEQEGMLEAFGWIRKMSRGSQLACPPSTYGGSDILFAEEMPRG